MTESNSEPQVPPLTEELRAQARRSPGSWLYSVDPAYDVDGTVPPYAIAGAWPVDDQGEPGAFTPNPDYRPSPAQLLLADPTDPVDVAMQLAATGHGPQSAALEALVATTVYLPANTEGELTGYEDENGAFIKVLTDPQHASPTAAQLVPIAFTDLLEVLPVETAIRINPDSDVSMTTSTADLRAFLDASTTPSPAQPAPAPSPAPVLGIPHKGDAVNPR